MAKSKGGLSVRATDIVNILNGDHLSTSQQTYTNTNLIGLALKMDEITNREYVDVKICSVHYIQNNLYAVEVPFDHDIYEHRKGYNLDTKEEDGIQDLFFEYDFLMNRHDIYFGFGYVGKKEVEMLTNFLNPQEGEDNKRILILGAKTDYGNQASEDHYFTFMLDTLPHDYEGEIPVDNIDQLLGVPAWLTAIPCPPVWRTDDKEESPTQEYATGNDNPSGNQNSSEYEASTAGSAENGASNENGESALKTNLKWREALEYAVENPLSKSELIDIAEANMNQGINDVKG